MSFEDFAAARLPALLRYAVVLRGDRDDGHDLVQEVLARALVKWDALRGWMSRTPMCAGWSPTSSCRHGAAAGCTPCH